MSADEPLAAHNQAALRVSAIRSPITLRDRLESGHRRITPQQVTARTGAWAFATRYLAPQRPCGATYLNAA